MSLYPKSTVTNAGLDLIGASIAEGKALIFTKVVLGDGQLASGASISTMTAVINPLMTIPLKAGTQESGKVKLRFAVDNSALEAGFFAREVGVFAKVGTDGTEALYAYTNGRNYVDYVPDKSNPLDVQDIDIYCVTGNASTVQVVIDGTAYVTIADLASHNASDSAHANRLIITPTASKPTSMATGGLWIEELS